MRRTRLTITLPATLALAAAPALAQPSASILTTANGGSSATISPGQIVSISVTLSHNQFSVAALAGSTIITDDAGQGQNYWSPVPIPPHLQPPIFTGGSIYGRDIAFTPPGFIGGATPPSNLNPMPLWTYDIAGLTPGVYDITWIPDAQNPDIRLFSGISSFSSVPAQSTYIGATITVLPAPAPAATIALAAALGTHRRRTSKHGANDA